MNETVVAALQIGSSPEGTQSTLEKILGFEEAITASGAKLVVMPEAVLGGYPKGETFGTYLGYRLPEGRETFRQYYEGAVSIPGPEIEALEGLARRTGAFLVAGVIERGGSTLYCTAVFIDPERGYVGKHRKLMPTASERLIWGQGDGSTLTVADSRGWPGWRGDLLGKLHAAAAHGDVRERRRDLVRADGRRARDVGDIHAPYRL